ncbi:hypothetical protein [Ramlibacter sp. AN1133]|uniref:hypothetical protein n=1 Tax=Ramlibacter sp. AN1133 TaxID=3133429 RepID=UPI0030C57F6E
MALTRLLLSETLQRLGRPGVIGIALLASSLGLAVSTVLPSWQELARLRAKAAATQEYLRTAAARAPRADESPAGQLRAFYAFFPLHTEASESLSHMFAAARESRLQLSRGEYAIVTDRQTGLVVYRMTLPVRGGYTQIREFVAASLKAVPALALDEVTFERPKISETQVQARVRLTLYLRAAS